MRDVIANMLVDANFTSYFTKPVSVLVCAEPIVVGRESYKELERGHDWERGEYSVPVFIVRDTEAAARHDADELARVLRHGDWERACKDEAIQIVALQVSTPEMQKRDTSGRYLFLVQVKITITRDLNG